MIKRKTTLQPFLIVGRKNSGKTTFLLSIAAKLKEQDFKVGGFVGIGEFKNGVKQRYYLQNLETGGRKLLATTDSSAPDSISQGSYSFDSEVFDWANQTLVHRLNHDAIIIDEYGPLECREKGLFPSLDFLLRNYRGSLFVAVRPALVSQLSNLLERHKRFERMVIQLNPGRPNTFHIVGSRMSRTPLTNYLTK